jgi:autotransporter-associated beta strand protein
MYPKMNTRTTPLFLTAAAALAISGTVANATTYYWNTTGTNNWADGAFWSDDATSGGTTGTIAGASDIAVFNQSSVNGDLEANIAGVATSVGGLVFNNTGTTGIRTNGGNQTLTIGSGGITINAGAGAVSFGSPTNTNGARMTLELSADQTWLNNSSNALVLSARNRVNMGSNTLTFDGTGDFSQSSTSNSPITGTGSLIKKGSGTLTLTQTNTYTGSTTINAGTLEMTNNAAIRYSWLDTAGSIVGDASNGLKTTVTTFIVGGLAGDKDLASIFTTTAGGYDGLTALTLGVDAANSFSYSGDIADGAAGMSVSLNGAGVQTLSGDNTYTGNTTLSSGTLNIGSATAIGTGTFVINGGTFDNTSGSALTLTNNQAISIGNASWTFGGSNDLNLGTGAVALNLPGIGGTSVITLGGTGSTLTFGGHVDSPNRNGNTSIEVNGAGNTLVFGSLSLNDSPNNRVINFTGSADITVNGEISDGSSGGNRFNYAGTGTFTMGGAGTYSGATTVSSGTLLLADSLAMQNSALNTAGSIAGDASSGLKTTVSTLTFGGLTGDKDLASVFTTTSGGYDGVTALTLNRAAGTNSYSGAIADGASGMDLNKTGDGTQTLTGTSTYTGATNVIAGTLVVDGSIASSSLVTVDSGATLGGSGNLGAAVIDGTLAIGNSPGTMTFSSLTLAGTAIYEIDGTAGAGVVGGHDFADISGALVYGGDLTLDIGTIFTVGNYTFDLFDFGSESGDFASIVLADQYSGSLLDGDLDGIWDLTAGNDTWQFTQSTGILTLDVVPEPSSYALLAGLLGLSYVMVRRRK